MSIVRLKLKNRLCNELWCKVCVWLLQCMWRVWRWAKATGEKKRVLCVIVLLVWDSLEFPWSWSTERSAHYSVIAHIPQSKQRSDHSRSKRSDHSHRPEAAPLKGTFTERRLDFLFPCLSSNCHRLVASFLFVWFKHMRCKKSARNQRRIYLK